MYQEENYLEFKHALKTFEKEKAYLHIKSLLDNQTLTIIEIYELYLAKSLSEIAGNNLEQQIPIWQEHLISNIVRSIVELTYPYVLIEKGKTRAIKQSVVILCLEEEYHDLGARMVQDFFEIAGFTAYFIGANTPDSEIESALQVLKPEILCISVTNYYHLSKLHKLLNHINELFPNHDFKIAVGGYAIQNSSKVESQIQADYYLKSFEDITNLKEVLS
ncbi:MAG: cobalamin B12-binding domain-containing protein [Clostridia bacterium]|nr:cobalamin B12-binding domain-containing protein [Clostridia bacterium]